MTFGPVAPLASRANRHRNVRFFPIGQGAKVAVPDLSLPITVAAPILLNTATKIDQHHAEG